MGQPWWGAAGATRRGEPGRRRRLGRPLRGEPSRWWQLDKASLAVGGARPHHGDASSDAQGPVATWREDPASGGTEVPRTCTGGSGMRTTTVRGEVGAFHLPSALAFFSAQCCIRVAHHSCVAAGGPASSARGFVRSGDLGARLRRNRRAPPAGSMEIPTAAGGRKIRCRPWRGRGGAELQRRTRRGSALPRSEWRLFGFNRHKGCPKSSR
ncbi:unnamed protein product [Urochloa humidicola]